MNPDFWKGFGQVVALLLSLPLAYALWSAGRFFGEFRQTMKTVQEFVRSAKQEIDALDTRVTKIETARATEKEMRLGRRHHSRRAGDPPPADDGDDLEEGA